MARTEVIRRVLPDLLQRVGARSLLDAPCGDFNWMQHVDLSGVDYLGADVVPDLIARNQQEHGGGARRFELLDVTRDPLPRVDVILCRDCLTHLSFEDIRATLRNFQRSGSRFLLATTHSVAEHHDIATGEFRMVNLQLPPIGLPPPTELVVEDAGLRKCLGLWALPHLRIG